tara:strand:+ start:274 stop:963 length:690 start_codon:yes stop_codon:yes gene_type:complete
VQFLCGEGHWQPAAEYKNKHCSHSRTTLAHHHHPPPTTTCLSIMTALATNHGCHHVNAYTTPPTSPDTKRRKLVRGFSRMCTDQEHFDTIVQTALRTADAGGHEHELEQDDSAKRAWWRARGRSHAADHQFPPGIPSMFSKPGTTKGLSHFRTILQTARRTADAGGHELERHLDYLREHQDEHEDEDEHEKDHEKDDDDNRPKCGCGAFEDDCDGANHQFCAGNEVDDY